MEKGQVWTPLGIHLWDISLCFWSDRSDLIADIRFNRIQCKWCRGAKFKFALGNWHRFANYWEEGPKLPPPKSANYRGQGSPRPLKKGEGCGVPPWVSNVVYRRLRDASEIFEAPRRGDYFRRKRHRKCLEIFLQKMVFFTEILSIF